MINLAFKGFRKIALIAATTTSLFSSCEHKKIMDAEYLPQKIYIPGSVIASRESGENVYTITSLAVPGADFRYKVDVAQNKFFIPLTVYRSGANIGGDVQVNVVVDAAAANARIAEKNIQNIELLPDNERTVPSSLVIPSGKTTADLNVAVDLDYLLANPASRKAIAITVTSPTVEANTNFNTIVIMIDPTILTLVPTANFSAAVIQDSKTMVKFLNSSTNGASYRWDFGDGSAPSSQVGPVHTYPASGATYTATLTVFNALGEAKAVKTASVVIP